MIKPLETWILFALVGCVVAFQSAAGQPRESGDWRPLFNGDDLSGWTERNGDHIFEARDGQIVGTTVPGQPNGFLTTDETFGDFILELEVKVDVLMNNSGIQFRSLSHAGYRDFRVHGYQAEIDTKPQRWSGSIYDEARRGWLYVTELNPASKSAFVNNTWNHYRIEAIGTTNRVWVNGIPTAHLVDDETTRGFIGLQLHANNPYDPPGSHQIRFRNIRIQTENLRPSPLDDLFVVNLIPNHLSEQERTQGYHLLWDGQDTGGWSAAGGASFAEAGWQAVDGTLRTSSATKDAVSAYHGLDAFELKFDFMPLEEGAVCGMRYLGEAGVRDAPERGAGPDDGPFDDGPDRDVQAGDVSITSQYCQMASQKLDRDGWNQGVVRVRADGRVEYWLNGHLVLEYLREFDDRAGVFPRDAASGGAAAAGDPPDDAPQAARPGRVTLQQPDRSGGQVAYRSIKIRPL